MENIVERIVAELMKGELKEDTCQAIRELGLPPTPQTDEVVKMRWRTIDFLVDTIHRAGMKIVDAEHLSNEFRQKDEQIAHWKQKYEKKIYAND